MFLESRKLPRIHTLNNVIFVDCSKIDNVAWFLFQNANHKMSNWKSAICGIYYEDYFYRSQNQPEHMNDAKGKRKINGIKLRPVVGNIFHEIIFLPTLRRFGFKFRIIFHSNITLVGNYMIVFYFFYFSISVNTVNYYYLSIICFFFCSFRYTLEWEFRLPQWQSWVVFSQISNLNYTTTMSRKHNNRITFSFIIPFDVTILTDSIEIPEKKKVFNRNNYYYINSNEMFTQMFTEPKP